MEPDPLVYIVILSWNGVADTLACVASCRKVHWPRLRVLVVDNGSTDGSEEAVRREHPWVEVLQTGANLGYTGGNNAGLRHALARGADYAVLLNNDTEVHPAFVQELVAAARARPSAGLLSSKVYFHSEPDRLWYAGASFHSSIGWGRHRGYGQRDRGQFDVLEPTPRACGCSLMATRALCEGVGLLHEEYFAYCEDLDWSLRARRAGFEVLYVPGSLVWHKVARATGGARSGIGHYFYTRNMLLCLDRNLPLPWPLRAIRAAAVLGNAIAGVVVQGVPWRVGFAEVVRGLRDWRASRFGPRPPR